MALTKVTTSGITDDAVNAAKIADGTLTTADIAPGTITTAKLAGSITNAKLANSSITLNGAAVALGGSTSLGSISWQSVVVADGSTATTGVAGRGYFINTTSATHTLNLPSSPSAGDTIAIKDYAGTFGSNALTIGRNSKKIQGNTNDSTIETDRASIVCVFIDDTKGWLFTNESNVADFGPKYIAATGGTVTTSGDYKIHTFTGDGNFVVSQAAANVPDADSKVDHLIIAGGGGGGGSNSSTTGGGAGAGAYRVSATHYSGPSLATGISAVPVSATTYPITIGGGGSGGQGAGAGVAGVGANSVFSTITSSGGGRGGCAQNVPNPNAASSSPRGATPSRAPGNGSGGGGAGSAPNTGGQPGGTYGNDGRPGINPGAGGGGGGAGGNGNDGNGDIGGGGGSGDANSITGSPVSRANGGPAAPRAPGSNGTNATANTGAGGPSAQYPNNNGGNGGSGIAIIRYKYQA
tara:strand:+ start:2803 stop:4200 length:1398 start_codon:yes stop_codon:yes gene_type:complete